MKRVLSPLLGLAVSAVFVWLVLRQLDVATLVKTILSVDLRWVLVALVMFAVDFSCRIWRWKLMLSVENPRASWLRCSVPFMASIAVNNVLPLRAGDALRTVAFSNWLGVSNASILATMIIERLLDLLVLLFALAAAMMFFEVVSLTDGPLLGGSAVALMAGTLLMGVLLAFPETFEPFVRMGLARIERHSPVLGAKLIEAFSRLIQTLRVLTRGWRAISLLFWTIAAWFFEGAVFYAIARAIPDLTNPAAAWFAMPVGTLSTLLPSTPGYVGTFHYFVSRSAELLGNTAAAAAAFSVATHLLLWASATLWGAVSFAAWLAMRSERHPNIGTSP